MKVVVAGAGYVGGALALRLASQAHDVWAIRRTASQEASSVPSVRGVVADVVSGAGLEQLPDDVDAVVYAVAPDTGSDDAYRAAYPEGTRTILERFSDARLLLVSSTSVYGQDAGQWVDETSATEPRTPSALRILEAERLAHASPRNAVVRSSGIYGPGRTSLLERVSSGDARLPQRPVYTNRIHRDDLVAALEFLLLRPELGGTFIATDTEPVELGQLLAWLAARLDVPSPPLEGDDAAPRSRHRHSRRCLPRRLSEAGFNWLYPTFREGYAGLLGERKSRAPRSP